MKQYIRELKDASIVDSVFSVKYKKPPVEYKNGFRFVVGLADKSGEIEANYWGGRSLEAVMKAYGGFKEDDIVHLRGAAAEFQGKLRIDVNENEGRIEKTLKYEVEDFIPVTEKNIEEMFCQIVEVAESVENEHLKKLLKAFFNDLEFVDQFKKSPAAMYIHQAYVGGLLEHTLNVVRVCETIYKLYPELDRNLLLTGAILHDIGKIKELQVTTNIKVSEEGLLRGHIVLGEELVMEKIKRISDFPENLKIKMSHLMLSHHGSNEFGSPKKPSFPEAVAVYYADECDSQISQFVEAKKSAETEDFHTYSKRLGQIYLK
ncbi:HD domain-containing protein [Candidatus Micrarchaeota archaeon]|nr:HD domain-containing protein [Candidatus Micrarchaeota archaeon]